MNDKEPYVNKYIKLELKDKILLVTYSRIKMDLKIAHSIVDERFLYTEGKTYPVYINSENLISVDRDAQEYLTSSKALQGVTAAAIGGKSFYATWLGNFFINFLQRKTPFEIRFFSDKEKALKWLKQFTTSK
jgi:hypothetical protein